MFQIEKGLGFFVCFKYKKKSTRFFFSEQKKNIKPIFIVLEK